MDKRRLPFGGLEYAALLVLLLFLFVGILAPLIMPYAPDQINMGEVLKAPGRRISWVPILWDGTS